LSEEPKPPRSSRSPKPSGGDRHPRRRRRRGPRARNREAAANEQQPTPIAEQSPAAAAVAAESGPDADATKPDERQAQSSALTGKATPAVADERGQLSLYERLWMTGLPTVGAIARRELGAYFVSPIGYVVAAVLVLPVSFLGYLARIGQGLPVTMDPIFGLIALLMVFFTPLYTMRLLAEERRTGTLEVLLTSPVRDWELVVGKWLGSFVFYLATIAFTVVYVVLLSVFTQTHYPATVLGLHLELPTVDYGRIVAGYVGVALVGAAWVALGLFASSLTSNQIIAAVVGVGLLLAFQYLFGTLATFLVSPYSDFFDYLNASNHAGSFSAGRLVPKDAVYFITLTAGALFLTTRVVESRKWR
jgi:ABC-2 type transport system permease protein